jgi:hypothetical protein
MGTSARVNRGLLLTMTEPPPGMAEEEFNAWYDSEHIPERLSIPGFRSARRWVADCSPGEGKYLATYELESPAVLQSPRYLSFFEKPSPWSRRCLDKAAVFRRWACEQIGPGDAGPHAQARAVVPVFEERRLAVPAVLQVRSFLASSGEPRHVTLYELADSNVDLPGALRVYRAYAA